jgi:hypothetical protein
MYLFIVCQASIQNIFVRFAIQNAIFVEKYLHTILKNEIENKKYHTVGTVVEKGKIDTPNTNTLIIFPN